MERWRKRRKEIYRSKRLHRQKEREERGRGRIGETERERRLKEVE